MTHVEDRLSAYLDGELTVADAAHVRQHLALCPPCAARHDALRSVDRAFRDLLVEAPPGYFDTFSARVRDRIAASRRPSRFLPVWSLAAAAALALAALLPRLPWNGPPSPRPAEVALAPVSPPSAAATPATSPALAPSIPLPKRESAADEAGKRTDVGVASQDARDFAAPPSEPTLQDRALARAEAPALSVDLERGGTTASGVVGEAADGAARAPQVAADAYEREAHDAATLRTARRVPEPALEQAPAAPSAGRPAPTTGALAAKEARSPKVAAAGVSADRNEEAYDALLQQEALIPGRVSVDKLRSLRTAWRAFIGQHPTSPRADEARVRVVELGVDIARRSGERRDAEEARRDGRDYLGRRDAAQKDRVGALVAGLER